MYLRPCRVKTAPVSSIEFYSIGTVPGCIGFAPATNAVCVNDAWVVPAGYAHASLGCACTVGLCLLGRLCVRCALNLHAASSLVSQINATTGQIVVVNGSLTLQPNSTVIATVSAPGEPLITVTEVLILDGELTIVLSTDLADGSEISIASAAEINGTFTQITVTPARTCQRASATPKQTLTTYSIVLNVDSSGCNTGGGSRSLSGAVIAGIVVGVVIFATIAALIILMIVKRINPRSLLFRKRAKTRSQMDYDIYAN